MEAKILFVDDESKVLESIENQLFGKLDVWEMDFAASGEKAIKMMETKNYDIVVADMRMPGMDGAELLKYVHDHQPDAMRVVLSGHAIPEAAIAAIPYAHQYLSKPCTRDTLVETIDNAMSIRGASDDPDVRLGISKVMDLPSHLGVYTELAAVLDCEQTDFADVAKVIEKDASLTVKMMFVANSALFATSNPAGSTFEAVQRLGGQALKMLVLAVEISGLIDDGDDPAAVERREHQERVTQIMAQLLYDHPRHQMSGTLAAVLHDLGFMVFMNFISERYQQNVLSKASCKAHRVELEIEEFNVSYAQLGALLLKLWRLPEPVIDAVGNQHSTNPEDFEAAPVSAALMLADFLVEDADVEDHLESVLELLPEQEVNAWRERIDSFTAVST